MFVSALLFFFVTAEIQGSSLHPKVRKVEVEGQPLRLEQRLYPGDETVRGFGRGGLSPWALVPGNQSPLQPAGADTLLGFSAEYRIPVTKSLSGAAFFDLGWTKLSPDGAASLGARARLLEGTNELLRASTGGELRLQLPIIHQPARLIFAWNPLRLIGLVSGTTSPVRIADPRSSIHFALGNIF